MGYVNKLDPLYVNFFTQQTANTNNEYLDVIQLSVAHTPPLWAHSWNIYGYNQPKYYK